MSDLYKALNSLCESRGITGYRMCKDLGIQPSLMTDLKMGRKSSMKIETANKISSYFNVDVSALLGEEKAEAPTLNKKDERDIAKSIETIMSELDGSGDLMFNGNPMSDEARDSMRAAMKLGLEAAKLKNKEHFTPKKYRKG
ncbi:MAG: helix-turn-helix transcriptional regulator [Bacteroides sp.]